MKRTILMVLLGGMLTAACGGGDAKEPAATPMVPEPGISDPLPPADEDATFPAGMGPGISVADALAAPSDEPLLVNGYLFVFADGRIVLADLIAESFPPQPGGAQVSVEGLDLMQIPLTEGPSDIEIAITAWTDLPVQLIGRIVDGVFVGNSVASA
jgi:hypothetical protein